MTERGIDGGKIKPLPRWVDFNMFSPDNYDPHIWDRYDFHETVRLLYVGRVSKEKNMYLLAEAFRTLIDSGYSAGLVIVGDGPAKEDMENLLEGYPVLFTGYKTGPELLTLYASADLFVFPSATDTFGNVVLEAQASGLPVIVSDSGGPGELMVDGETGIITKAGDADSLVRAMRFFADSPATMKKMGGKARQFVVGKGILNETAYSTILGRLKSDDLVNF